MEIDKSKPICVTGASGYIASWIVKYLLDDGCTVHATVRNPENERSVGHLQKIALEAQAESRLKFFKADLLAEGAFDNAIRGCELVIHTASPFIIKGFSDANEALVRPAVEGTANVLEACKKVGGVKRVVLTSSVASVFGDNIECEKLAGGVFNESHWNQTSSVSHQPYSYSKVMAEKKAWEICETQTEWDLITINPSLVMGPSLTTNSQSTSIDVMRDLGSGRQKTGVPFLMFGLVDVRDVARAHIAAGFEPKAKGRYITSNVEATLLQMATILKQRFPKYPLPSSELPKFVVWLVGPIAAGVSRSFVKLNVGYPVRFDNSRSREELKLDYLPLEQTLIENFEQMIEQGLLKRR